MFRFRPWLLWTTLAVSASGVFAGEASQPWIRGIYTGESPRPVVTELEHAWQQASDLAERTPRAFVLVGSGKSMRPLYEAGTILVLRQVPYAQLKYGQTVLYRNRQQKVVAHVLVARGRDGWRVRGLNNRMHDAEPLCAENLVGVVIAAYQPAAPRPLVRLAGMR
ncbi:MAG: S24 family peptidase [Oleiharenicola lentus]